MLCGFWREEGLLPLTASPVRFGAPGEFLRMYFIHTPGRREVWKMVKRIRKRGEERLQLDTVDIIAGISSWRHLHFQ